MEWRLRRVVPAAAVTTHAKPHAQQQLARGAMKTFFFQAEDGIRDRSPSRGLGDVYKRQGTPLHVCTAVRVPKYYPARNVEKVLIARLPDHVHVTAVRAAWHEW